jgi:hypothetical protein
LGIVTDRQFVSWWAGASAPPFALHRLHGFGGPPKVALCFRPVFSGGARSGAMHFCLARLVAPQHARATVDPSPPRGSLLNYLHFGQNEFDFYQ